MNPGPVIVDTGAWLFALAGEQPYADALKRARPAIVPSVVLVEIDWHLRRRRPEMHRILGELKEGRYVYEPLTLADVERAAVLDKKFADVGLGLVDAAIAALSERLGVHRILTIDSDFAAVRIGRHYRQSFVLVVPVR